MANFYYRITPQDGPPTIEAGDFSSEHAAFNRADALNGANYGRARVEVFREDRPGVILYRPPQR
jgi:hypothetical protein